jgi:hypothetical protein
VRIKSSVPVLAKSRHRPDKVPETEPYAIPIHSFPWVKLASVSLRTVAAKEGEGGGWAKSLSREMSLARTGSLHLRVARGFHVASEDFLDCLLRFNEYSVKCARTRAVDRARINRESQTTKAGRRYKARRSCKEWLGSSTVPKTAMRTAPEAIRMVPRAR